MKTRVSCSEIRASGYLGCRSLASSCEVLAARFLKKIMKDFKKPHIWQRGMEIVDRVYHMVPFLPSEGKFGMKSQIARSATAIPGNIAEGGAKKSQRDYSRFIDIALGSAFETHSLIVERRKWIDENSIKASLQMLDEEQKMFQAFIKKLSYGEG
jgi:four helix bundle protein